MKKLLLIIALVVVIGGLYWWQNKETAGWQIYKNEKYGFEFKYPVGWYAGNQDRNSQYLICLNPTGVSGDCTGLVTVSWGVNFTERYSAIKNLFVSQSVEESEVNFSGAVAKLLTIENPGGFSRELLFEQNGFVYNIGMVSGKEDVFDQILSTFRFVQTQNSVVAPLGWKTYRGIVGGAASGLKREVEFNYPSDWQAKNFYYIGSRFPERFDPNEVPSGVDLISPVGDKIIVFGSRASMDTGTCEERKSPGAYGGATKCVNFSQIPIGDVRTDSNKPQIQEIFDQVVSSIKFLN